MSYWLEDADGNYLGDLATNVGINQLRELDVPAVSEFLDEGVAGEDLLLDVVAASRGNPKLHYLVPMLDGAKAPVYVTDGCGHANDLSLDDKLQRLADNVFCPTGEGGGVDPSCSREGKKTQQKLTADDKQQLESWGFSATRKMRTSNSFGRILDKLPSHKGIIYRGALLSPAEAKQLTVDSVYTMQAHSSAAKEMGVAAGYCVESEYKRPKSATVKTLFVFHQHSGADLKSVEDAVPGEVVVKKGTKFKITSIETDKTVVDKFKDKYEGLTIISMKEIKR